MDVPESRIRTTGSSTLSGAGPCPAETIADWLRELPATAHVSVSTDRGDRPFEGGTWSLTASWDSPRG